MDTEIVTERLRMRRARPDDLDAVLALVSDRAVVENTATWPYPADRAFTAQRVVPVDPARGMVGPVLHEGEIIGLMGVIDGDLGYMFARAHWGRGYATEMGRALVDHVFATYNWRHLEAGVFEGNPASAWVLQKLGFFHVSDETQMCTAAGRDRPLAVYHLTRAAWRARHGH